MPTRPLLSAQAYAPASIANLGPGFDTLGVALAGLGDFVTAVRSPRTGVRCALRAPVPGLPARGASNVASVVARALLRAARPGFGVDLMLDKRLPIGSGLGSSAASSVAAAVAVNALLPRPLARADLLPFALVGERHAAGTAHADNAAPALFGGVCLVRGGGRDGVLQLTPGAEFTWVIAHPHVIVRTARARRVLPRAVPLERAVRQWANVGGLVAGLVSGDPALAGACMEDVIVEPVRAPLIPGFTAVQRAARRAGAAGCSIAGSGPSVFALAPSAGAAPAIARAMRAAFARAGLACDVHVAATDGRGARVVRRRRA